MAGRWSWPSGLLAFSSVAVTVAALVWSFSDEKARPRRRKDGADEDDDDDDEDDAVGVGSSQRTRKKGGRDAFCGDGAEIRLVSADKARAEDIGNREMATFRAGALSSQLTLNNGGSAWSMQRTAGTSAWSGASNLSPTRCQAAMSANEKKELDLMFRHQERHEGRGVGVVDIARAKQARQRNRQRREVLPAERADTLEDPLADLLAEELLAEEEAASSPSPRQKKVRQRKPRKRNKARTDVSQSQASLEEFECEQGEPLSPDDVEAPFEEGDQDERLSFDEPEAQASLPPMPQMRPVESEKSQCRMVCDASVQTNFPAGTPTTEGPSSLGAPSTRQGSESGDDALILHEATAAVSSNAVATCEPSEETSEGKEPSERCDVAPESLMDHSREGLRSSPMHRQDRKQRAWADLTDASDDEPSSACWAVERLLVLPENRETTPVDREAAKISDPAEELVDTSTTTVSGQSDERSGAAADEEVEFKVPHIDAAPANVVVSPEQVEESSFFVPTLHEHEMDYTAVPQVRQDWVMVQTRQRTRKKPKP
jgi:hypothetical protein